MFHVFMHCLYTAKAKVVITANEAVLGKKKVPLKENLDQALDGVSAEVKRVLVAHRTTNPARMLDERDIHLEKVCYTKY